MANKEILDKNGDALTRDSGAGEVVSNLNEIDGIQLSPLGMAMLDVMVTAGMLNLYGAQVILKEAPDSIDEINKVVTSAIERLGEFSIDNLKQNLMMAFQIACMHQAEDHAKSIVKEGLLDARERLKGDDTTEPYKGPCEATEPKPVTATAADE